MKNHEDTEEVFDLLTSDDEVKHAYDRQKSIIKIAELIKALRENAGMTQTELAVAIDSRQTAISRMESYDSDNMPNLETLILIFHACGKELNLNANSYTPIDKPVNNVVHQTFTESVQVAF